MRHIFKTLLLPLFILCIALPAVAVTQDEMEQARTITAFWYLRYANDGAGYMEQGKMPTTMAGLEKMLKETERNNLKAFKAVKTPDDYAGWDKKKLIAYWGDSFFSSPGLTAKGKVARNRVKSKLGNLTIAAPAPAPAAAEEAASTTAPAAPAVENGNAEKSGAADNTAPADASAAEALPAAAEIVENAEALDSAALALEESAQESKARHKSGSGSTWIYIIALVILVGVVIWLVIFASKTMQEGNRRKEEDEEEDSNTVPVVRVLPEHRRKEPVAEVSAIETVLPVKAPDNSAEVRALNREIKGLREECTRLGQENGRLQSELTDAHREIEMLRQQLRSAAKPSTQVQPVAAPVSAPRQQAPVSAPSPRQVAEKPTPSSRQVSENEGEAREIYLGRVNPKGLFVRADRRPVPEKSVFVLTTTDGYTGTYRVLQIAEVIERCLDNPDHYLAGGCTAPDILATEDAAQIRTLQAGTAIFENGCWRMIRKTKIVYE